MLIYAIGDIHGCHDQAVAAVAMIKAKAKKPYRGIFLGDYVDRGPKSRQVVNLIRGLVTSNGTGGTWEALKGNHEDMMFNALHGQDEIDLWVGNGGANTIASYETDMKAMREDAAWLAKLPVMITTDKYCFVHAGISPIYPLDKQPEEVSLWIRGWQKSDPDVGKHVVYGHTPAQVPRLLTNSSCLDTGACFGWTLTVGVFDDERGGGPVDTFSIPGWSEQ